MCPGGGSLIEIAGPEVVVLHDERDNAGLQLSHESVLCYDGVYVRLLCCQVKGIQPRLHARSAACFRLYYHSKVHILNGRHLGHKSGHHVFGLLMLCMRDKHISNVPRTICVPGSQQCLQAHRSM